MLFLKSTANQIISLSTVTVDYNMLLKIEWCEFR